MADPHDVTSNLDFEIDTIIVASEADVVGADGESELIAGLASRFQIIDKLGEGGMGVVYKARNVDLDRVCALKLLKRQAMPQAEQEADTFFHEARAAAAMNHPNIVTIYSVGQAESTYFIEMEYVQGATLAQIVRDEGPMQADRATRLIKQSAEALGEAHQAGIVHRDIKPSNILLDRRRTLKVTDFGLATRAAYNPWSQQGLITGSPHFMAPEQCEGRECDARSDIYSLGATYFYCVTGQHPFPGEQAGAILYQHLYKAPPNAQALAPNMPDSVASVIRTAMAKEPEERFQSCAEFVGQLNIILSGRPGIEVILEEATRGLAARYVKIDEGYEIALRLDNGRSQQVRVIMGRKDSEDHEIVMVYSRCAPAHCAAPEWALRFNSQLSYGALALETVDGEDTYVMFNTHLLEGLDPPELRKSVLHVGQRADRLEERLTDSDLH